MRAKSRDRLMSSSDAIAINAAKMREPSKAPARIQWMSLLVRKTVGAGQAAEAAAK